MPASASNTELLSRPVSGRQSGPGWAAFQGADPRFPAAGFAQRPDAEELSIGFVGTYPPLRCGIASFTASLARAMALSGSGVRMGVVACVDRLGVVGHPPEVAAEFVRGSAASRAAAAATLDEFDLVVVQHEFGIFGGEDGCEIVDLVARLHVPAIVVLHTVPRRPTSGQRAVVERLAEFAERIVTQSHAARVRLLETHLIEPRKVVVIPHGAPANLVTETSTADPARRPVVLTWGLVGPGKGIEWAIEAMAFLRDLEPQPRYVVAGQTHPRILETRGEEYRDSLVARAAALGVSHLVEFDGVYRDLGAILARIREADVVLLPYLSREQVVSGVLAEAVASGKPVVSTRFPHAEELLGEGSGILVAHEDAEAIAGALRSLLSDPDRTARMAAVARRQAPSLFWENVGASYLQLARDVVCDAEHVREVTLSRPPFVYLLQSSGAAEVDAA